MRKDAVSSVIAIVVLTLVLGLAYPLLVTGVSQVAFPGKADGSRVERDGKIVGSRLIGQDFRGDRRYFQSRPSATKYNAAGTAFSNLGPNSQDLRDRIVANQKAYVALEAPYNPGLTPARVPNDAVQTSASSVDPHISLRNARIQAARVSAIRDVPKTRVLELIDDNVDGRFAGVLGERGVNVLELNLALDRDSR